MEVIQVQPEGEQNVPWLPCKVCTGTKYLQWWETSTLRALQCADPDCRVFAILKKVEDAETP